MTGSSEVSGSRTAFRDRIGFGVRVATPWRAARGSVARLRAEPSLRTGYLLTATSALSSLIGFGYWVLAARLYPASVVGTNAAAIYAMSFLAGLVQLTATHVVLRFVPDRPALARRMIAGTLALVAGLSAVAALIYLLGLPLWSPDLAPLLSSWPMAAVFVLATVSWGVFVQQSGALVAVARAGAVPVSNTAFALGKVGLVIAAAAVPAVAGAGVFLSWTVATALTAALTGSYLFRRAIPAFAARARPAGPAEQIFTRGDVARYAGPNLIGSIAWTATTTLSPILVLALVGADRGAVFTLAMSTTLCVYLVGSSFSQGLLAHGGRGAAEIETGYRQVVRQTLLVTGVAVLGLVLLGRWVLTLYGDWYAEHGTGLLRLLSASALPNALVAIELSRLRVLRDVRAVAIIQVATCALVLATTLAFVPWLGLAGAGLAWLLTQSLVALGCFGYHRRTRRRAADSPPDSPPDSPCGNATGGPTNGAAGGADPAGISGANPAASSSSRLPYRRLDVDTDRPGWAERSIDQLAADPTTGVYVVLRRAGVPVADLVLADPGTTTATDLTARLAAADPGPGDSGANDATPGPGATVVICTRGRPDGLRRVLASLAVQTDPDFEVLVVDNAGRPDGEVAAAVAAAVEGPGRAMTVTLIHEPVRGLSVARNTALGLVRSELVLWLDDDEEADVSWVRQVRATFRADPAIAAMSGRVLPARLESQADLLFEEFGGHNKGRGWQAGRFSRAELGPAVFYPLPAFGVGANMACRADVGRRIGFDRRLGAGSSCGGAEDTLFFSELLDAGEVLVYAPQAVTWHHHRADHAELAGQLEGYGRGIGGYYAALLWRRPSRLLRILQLAPRALRDQADPGSVRNAGASAELIGLRSGNRLAIVRGALRYGLAQVFGFDRRQAR